MTPSFTDHFATLASGYDVVLSDVWGVVHDGMEPFPDACDALGRFRARGGTVVLITNSPRPRDGVAAQIDSIGVPRASYDDVVTSGDVTRAVIAERQGEAVFHIGPERDVSMFADFVQLASVEAADYVLCSGLYDDTRETPDDYRELLGRVRARELFMVCANPDLVVERGPAKVYCAGSIADLYASLGGRVLYAGKPHPPIYQQALERAGRLRMKNIVLERVLAIGDSVRTDLTGAATLGVDCLFVTAGIHAEELGSREDPDAAVLGSIFRAAGIVPKAVTRRLRW
jgi:HAD superfamily hydrolase (TIGR01459 family)